MTCYHSRARVCISWLTNDADNLTNHWDVFGETSIQVLSSLVGKTTVYPLAMLRMLCSIVSMSFDRHVVRGSNLSTQEVEAGRSEVEGCVCKMVQQVKATKSVGLSSIPSPT